MVYHNMYKKEFGWVHLSSRALIGLPHTINFILIYPSMNRGMHIKICLNSYSTLSNSLIFFGNPCLTWLVIFLLLMFSVHFNIWKYLYFYHEFQHFSLQNFRLFRDLFFLYIKNVVLQYLPSYILVKIFCYCIYLFCFVYSMPIVAAWFHLIPFIIVLVLFV